MEGFKKILALDNQKCEFKKLVNKIDVKGEGKDKKVLYQKQNDPFFLSLIYLYTYSKGETKEKYKEIYCILII